MFNPLDIIAPRERQSYAGPSTKFRVTPRRISWFMVVWSLCVIGFVGSVIANLVSA